ncbi:hypothetical protein GCM10010415_64430 [Streptomyces atrovirens]
MDRFAGQSDVSVACHRPAGRCTRGRPVRFGGSGTTLSPMADGEFTTELAMETGAPDGVGAGELIEP